MFLYVWFQGSDQYIGITYYELSSFHISKKVRAQLLTVTPASSQKMYQIQEFEETRLRWTQM